MRQRKGLARYAVWLAALLLSGQTLTAAGETDVSTEIAVATDYIFRGVSQSMSSPVIQGTLAIDNENGWYGYAWASNIDFTQDGDPDDGAHLEVDLELGYYYDLSDRVAVSLGWANYLFPGTEPGIDYNYDEIIGSIIFGENHYLTVGYSDDVFASGSPGTFYAVGSGVDVRNVTLSAELGRYDLDRAYGTSYTYGEVALGGNTGLFDWRLSFVTTSDDASRIYYESMISDRLVMGVSKSFGRGE